MHALAVIYVLRAVEGVAEFKFIQHDAARRRSAGRRRTRTGPTLPRSQIAAGLAAAAGRRRARRRAAAWMRSRPKPRASIATWSATCRCRSAPLAETRSRRVALREPSPRVHGPCAPPICSRLPLRYKPWRPRHARLILRDLLRRAGRAGSSATSTICARPSTGCAARRTCAMARRMPAASRPAGASRTAGCRATRKPAATSSKRSSRPPELLERPELVERAHRIIDWELSLQHRRRRLSRAFRRARQPAGDLQHRADHARHAGRLPAARARRNASSPRCAAGHWLARQQDDDGCWRKFEHNGVPHTYNTRGTWALLATALDCRRRASSGARPSATWNGR